MFHCLYICPICILVRFLTGALFWGAAVIRGCYLFSSNCENVPHLFGGWHLLEEMRNQFLIKWCTCDLLRELVPNLFLKNIKDTSVFLNSFKKHIKTCKCFCSAYLWHRSYHHYWFFKEIQVKTAHPWRLDIRETLKYLKPFVLYFQYQTPFALLCHSHSIFYYILYLNVLVEQLNIQDGAYCENS